jgi:type IV secretion system protein VirB4
VFNRLKARAATERLIGDIIPWDGMMDKFTLLHDDDSVSIGYEMEGIPAHTAEPAEIMHEHGQANSAIQNAAEDNVVFHILQCRGLADPSIYPRGTFRSAFSESLDLAYREKLLDRYLWLNKTYLFVQLKQPRAMGNVWGELFPSKKRKGSVSPEALQKRLQGIAGTFSQRMGHYNLRPLTTRVRGNAVFSEMSEALAFAMTGVWRPVPLTTGRLADMFSERFIFGQESVEIRGPGSSSYAAMLGYKDFPYMTWPGMFSPLLSASFRCTLSQSFRCLNATEAGETMTRKQNRGKSAGDRALSQWSELTKAADLVASKRIMMGEFNLSMAVFSDDPMQLGDAVNHAWRDLAAGGAIVVREDKAVEASFLSMVPGLSRYRVRPGVVSSRNFCGLAAMHNYPSGAQRGHWGEPVTIFRTAGGTPYRFHLHVEDVGNILVTGEVGSGKSTWLGFIVSQAERLGTQVVLWDKDRGLEILVRALGGVYLRLGNPTGLAPLKALSSSPDDLTFLASLIRGMVSADGAYTWTPEEDRRLMLALRIVMSLPPEQRWLREIRAMLGVDRAGAGARLERWCWGNELGWVVDCPEDIINLDASIIGFDQTDFLDNPMARGPIMATLFHRTERLIDGRRLMFVIDEFWKSLQDPAFTDLVHDKLKTLRKRNSPILLGTQSARDAMKSPIAHTIREQCPTKVCFVNAGAVAADYCEEGLGLTETELRIVRGLPKGQGKFLLKQGRRSLVGELPLGGMNDEIAVLSGRSTTIKVLDAVRERLGDDADPTVMIKAFHEARKVQEVAA